MPRKPIRVRNATEHPELSKLARDVQEALDTTPDVEVKQQTGAFTTNMVIGLTRQPAAIELIRCLLAAAPETAVSHGTAVQWVWRPQQGGAQIQGIQGLVAGPTQYVLTFRITY